jgi:hypothetical protein
MKSLEVMAASDADHDVHIGVFVKIPSEFKARTQTILTQHPVTGDCIKYSF